MNGNTPDRKLLKQVNGIQSRVGSALLNTDLTAEEVANFPVKNLGAVVTEATSLIVARIRGIEPGQRNNVLIQNEDGSVSLIRTHRGLTDDHIVADFKAAGWGYINPAIRSDRRMLVKGKIEAKAGGRRTLTIANVVPAGTTWKFQKVTKTIGNTALAFDLEDLRDLVLEHRDELLSRGVRWVVAPAARFRSGNGRECVAFANFGVRELYLRWVEGGWDDDDWFGSSK